MDELEHSNLMLGLVVGSTKVSGAAGVARCSCTGLDGGLSHLVFVIGVTQLQEVIFTPDVD